MLAAAAPANVQLGALAVHGRTRSCRFEGPDFSQYLNENLYKELAA